MAKRLHLDYNIRVKEPRRVAQPPPEPVLIFDGDCGFCRFWLARWRHRTGDRVEYVPFQDDDVARRFPEIPRQSCARAVQLVDSDGLVYEAAEAVFRLLAKSGTGSSPILLRCYEHVPGVAAVTEAAYRVVADHRPLAAGVSTLLWGRVTEPSTYATASWVFRRLLGVVYLIAFWSLGT
ncbi:MAG: DUF393 domain-containing protein, partial [Acidobacteria bacterium]|nr:DUF393 domain-containing protein [Acidobacteriota bacterium]